MSNKTYAGVTVTSNTTLKKFPSSDSKESLTTSLSGKWAHASGFTLDKIKFSGPGEPIVVENSLEGVIPDLKLEFQGDDKSKGDLLATYKIKPATIKAKFDLTNQKTGEVSATAGSGAVTAGAIVSFKAADKKPTEYDFSVSAAYVQGPLTAGIVSSAFFKKFDLLASYVAAKDIVVAGRVIASKKDSGFSFSEVLAGTYQCNPNTFLKAKVTSDAVLGLSIKQKLDKSLSVVAWAEASVPAKSSPTFGFKAILG